MCRAGDLSRSAFFSLKINGKNMVNKSEMQNRTLSVKEAARVAYISREICREMVGLFLTEWKQQ